LSGVIEWQAEEPISIFLFYEFVPGDKQVREVKTKGPGEDECPTGNGKKGF
jgi:uncharacterized protein YecA (UPF0149 family)